MITEGEKTQIRQLLQQPQWQTAERVAEEFCQKVLERNSVRETEWETLRELLTREGIVIGVRKFIKELYTIAQSEK